MEITFFNRPYRIARLCDSGESLKFSNSESMESAAIMIPVKINGEGALEIPPRELEFLAGFDPDFLIYPPGSSYGSINGNNGYFPGFFQGSTEDIPDEFRPVANRYDTEEILEKWENPPGTGELHNFILECSSRRENTVTHVYPEGFPLDGVFEIPGEIDRERVFDIILSDRSGRKESYILPRTKLFQRVVTRFNREFKIRLCNFAGRQGFSLISNGESLPRYFRLPPRRELFSKVFQELGYTTRSASTTTFIDLFSGLADAGDFLTREYALPLIESLLDPGFKPFGSIRKIISGHCLPDSLDTSNELLYMLQRRILLRGFIFKCPVCRYEDFYFMKEVDEFFKCRGCLKKNLTPLRLPAAYRLNHIISEGHLHGAEATILTLNRLFQEAEESFIYSPELALKKKNSEMEIDIMALQDGKIILGEAKMGRLIKDRDFSPRDEFGKYLVTTKELGAHRVIFSTVKNSFYDMPLSKIDRFRRELSQEGLGQVVVEILGGSELMSRPETGEKGNSTDM